MAKWVVSAIILAALLTTAAASADVLTVYGYGNYNTAGNGLSLNVAKLDDMGGNRTLNSVTIYVTSGGHATFKVDNDDSTFTGDIHPYITRAWTLTGPGLSVSDNHTYDGSTVTLQPENGDGGTNDYTGPDGYDWGRIGWDNRNNGTTNVAAGFLSQYQANGGGNLALNLNFTTLLNQFHWISGEPTASVEVKQGGAPNLDLTVRVDYDYTYQYVPEPSTWALLGLGVVGFGIWRRRRS